jgi:antirestriction protein ArdC
MNVYEDVTSKIIDALEAGVGPWVRPWKNNWMNRNGLSGRPYRGINILVLNITALAKGYEDPRWVTFRDAKKLGGHVRKGETATSIVFWKFINVDDLNDPENDNEPGKRVIPLVKTYSVFNVTQCENLCIRPFEEQTENKKTSHDEVNHPAERIIALPKVHHGGSRACYSIGTDCVYLPHRHAFETIEHYYGTGLHEVVHWTGHESRLARVFGTRFGDEAYAFEELVAEIGSAFLGAQTGLSFRELRHPEYIGSWIRVLKGDNKAIFTASRKAQEASEYILKEAGLTEETKSIAGAA